MIKKSVNNSKNIYLIAGLIIGVVIIFSFSQLIKQKSEVSLSGGFGIDLANCATIENLKTNCKANAPVYCYDLQPNDGVDNTDQKIPPDCTGPDGKLGEKRCSGNNVIECKDVPINGKYVKQWVQFNDCTKDENNNPTNQVCGEWETTSPGNYPNFCNDNYDGKPYCKISQSANCFAPPKTCEDRKLSYSCRQSQYPDLDNEWKCENIVDGTLSGGTCWRLGKSCSPKDCSTSTGRCPVESSGGSVGGS